MTDIHDQRPDRVDGITHKITVIDALHNEEIAFYVTINRLKDGTPFEVFINCKHSAYVEHVTVATLMISRMLQSGIPIGAIAEELKTIQSPVTGHMTRKGRCPSLYARIGELLV